MIKSLFRERRRSTVIRKLGVLESPPEQTFDRLVDAAALAFDAPIALLSVIHDDRQSFKASRGLTIDCIPRDSGFCSFALDRDDVLESCDPLADSRFASLPVVTGAPYVRYYIGAPLRMLNGVDIGALCVLDSVARLPASDDQKAYLLGLARQASMALESRLDQMGAAA